MDSRPSISGLQPQNSTKRLIKQYEIMDTTSARDLHSSLSRAAAKLTNGDFLKKDKSAVRQSFRNLVGLFKKGKPKPDTIYDASHPDAILESHIELSDRPAETRRAPPCRSGTLLYWGRSSSPPAWITCTVTLQDQKITLAGAGLGIIVPSAIALERCTDVRSIPLGNLDATERALLPAANEHEEHRLFELLFDGTHAEKFAAASCHDRANWVSAIW
jgi:hypothetical protein